MTINWPGVIRESYWGLMECCLASCLKPAESYQRNSQLTSRWFKFLIRICCGKDWGKSEGSAELFQTGFRENRAPDKKLCINLQILSFFSCFLWMVFGLKSIESQVFEETQKSLANQQVEDIPLPQLHRNKDTNLVLHILTRLRLWAQYKWRPYYQTCHRTYHNIRVII